MIRSGGRAPPHPKCKVLSSTPLPPKKRKINDNGFVELELCTNPEPLPQALEYGCLQEILVFL
jgi:hypothetical protein